MVLVNLFLLFAFSDYLAEVRGLECKPNIKTMKAQIESIESAIPAHVAKKPKDEILAKLGFQEREFILITLLSPMSLAEKIEYAGMYTDCAKLHKSFLNAPTKTNLGAWTACVEHGYGRAPIPEVYTLLKSCYQKISN